MFSWLAPPSIETDHSDTSASSQTDGISYFQPTNTPSSVESFLKRFNGDFEVDPAWSSQIDSTTNDTNDTQSSSYEKDDELFLNVSDTALTPLPWNRVTDYSNTNSELNSSYRSSNYCTSQSSPAHTNTHGPPYDASDLGPGVSCLTLDDYIPNSLSSWEHRQGSVDSGEYRYGSFGSSRNSPTADHSYYSENSPRSSSRLSRASSTLSRISTALKDGIDYLKRSYSRSSSREPDDQSFFSGVEDEEGSSFVRTSDELYDVAHPPPLSTASRSIGNDGYKVTSNGTNQMEYGAYSMSQFIEESSRR